MTRTHTVLYRALKIIQNNKTNLIHFVVQAAVNLRPGKSFAPYRLHKNLSDHTMLFHIGLMYVHFMSSFSAIETKTIFRNHKFCDS